MTKKVRATAILGALGVALFWGCAAKKKNLPPQPSAPELLPGSEEIRDTAAASRRERIQARIAELFIPIYFEYDQSALSPQARSVLGAIGMFMKETPEISVTVEGHADERGTESYNLALGEKRAQVASSYLKQMGVEEGRLSVLSYGEERPAEEGTDERAWAKNRRDEFRVTF